MIKTLLTFVTLLSPAIAFADIPKTPRTANDIFTGFSVSNLSGLIPVLILVGVVTFLSGILKYLGAGDNEEKRAAGRQVMMFGIVVLFVMVSYWGFVNILTNSFFGKTYGIPNYLPALQK